MGLPLETIEAELLKLPHEDRAHLLEVLESSLEDDEVDEEQVADEWARKAIHDAAMSLPPEQRQEMAEALIASLPVDPMVESAWSTEIERRIEDLRTGKAKLIPAEEVFQEAEDLLR
ncbi:MAG TPA: addiction module protein [Longimicrobium sp.]|nr:addiction module protein [Longimicrobium sp.]